MYLFAEVYILQRIMYAEKKLEENEEVPFVKKKIICCRIHTSDWLQLVNILKFKRG